MGTILAVKKGNEIALGTDSLNALDTKLHPQSSGNRDCLLEVAGSFIGLASTPAYQLAFEAAMKNQDLKKLPSLLDVEGIFEFFLHMHEILRNHYGMYVNFQQSQEFEWSPMNAILVNPTGIFKIDSSRSIVECKCYGSIGSAKDFAIGAAAALYSSKKSAKQVVEAALQVTTEQESLHPGGARIVTVKNPNLKVTTGKRSGTKSKRSSSKKKSLKPVKGGKDKK